MAETEPDKSLNKVEQKRLREVLFGGATGVDLKEQHEEQRERERTESAKADSKPSNVKETVPANAGPSDGNANPSDGDTTSGSGNW